MTRPRALAAALLATTALSLAASPARADAPRIPTADFDKSSVVIASGDSAHLVDSVTAAPLAATQLTSVLLTPATGGLDPTTSGYLADARPRVVYVVGGATAVPTGVEVAIVAADPGAHVYRVAGATRYATAREVADLVDLMNADESSD